MASVTRNHKPVRTGQRGVLFRAPRLPGRGELIRPRTAAVTAINAKDGGGDGESPSKSEDRHSGIVTTTTRTVTSPATDREPSRPRPRPQNRRNGETVTARAAEARRGSLTIASAIRVAEEDSCGEDSAPSPLRRRPRRTGRNTTERQAEHGCGCQHHQLSRRKQLVDRKPRTEIDTERRGAEKPGLVQAQRDVRSDRTHRMEAVPSVQSNTSSRSRTSSCDNGRALLTRSSSVIAYMASQTICNQRIAVALIVDGDATFRTQVP